jgi:MFS family permease
VLEAFRSRDYRLFWSGSFAASLGTWIQQTALGWLVYDLTRSTSLLGTVSFCGNLPILVLGLVGGAIADRASRRTIMLTSAGASSAAALALAALTATDHVSIGWVIVLSMVAGSAGALYTPAMQAVVPGLVAGDQLLNAISLNSVQFNLARALGPAVAGLAYEHIRPTGCFALNAIGFVALFVAVGRLRLPARPLAGAPPLLRALRDGLRYVRRHGFIGPALVLATVLSAFGFPYVILLPALARDTLHLGPSGLGLLMAAVGLGAVTGGLGLAAAGGLPRRELLPVASAVAFGCCLAGFSVVQSARATGALLFGLGVLQTICIASLNTAIQTHVHDGMRGRVMSMMTVILFGVSTTGAVLVGTIADLPGVGVPWALAAGGGVIALAAVALGLGAPALSAAIQRA